MGHAASACLSEDRSQEYNLLFVNVPKKGTLEDVMTRELSQNKDKIKEMVLQAHRQALEPELGKEKYDLLLCKSFIQRPKS
jgi:hypothetical protein